MDHLSTREAKHVINPLSGLSLHAYRVKNKKARVTMDNIEHLYHMGSTIVLRNKQPNRRLIPQCLKLHPQLSRENAACIIRSQDCCKQRLYVMMYERECAFVMDRRGRTLYGVKGIINSLSFPLRNQIPPCTMQYTVLSYENHFILDSIGNTQVITDLSFVVELFEEYHSIAMEKGMLLSEYEIASFSVLECNMQGKREELFSDYLNPLDAILWNVGQNQRNSFLELVFTAWNLSYGSDKQAEEFFPGDVFQRYVRSLMEYHRTVLTSVKFLISRLEAPLEGEACMRIVEKREIEQLGLGL